MTRLNLEQIRAFLMVVRIGSIRGAADVMHLTQPAVTSRIKGLEAALGAQLFDREPTGLKLTKRGDLLLGYAEQFEQLAQKVEEDVVDHAGMDGHLRLGVSETIAQSWLTDFIAELHRQYPRVKIEISVDISLHLRENLLGREIDLAILLGPVSEYTVENLELPDFDLQWYCAAGQKGGRVDFTQTPVFTYARHTRPFRELKSELFERFGPDVSIFPSSSLSSCFRLVEHGLGVAALPRVLGQELVATQRIKEFDPGWNPKPLRFSASYMAEPKSHLVESAASIAREVALKSI
ncbi:MAG: LysR family transcriptional regulator [Rhodobacteraceae bacterium]|nr:LysR family transcriptional regulator [Paracoccaceae bacterium]